jgi:hypothetical protein
MLRTGQALVLCCGLWLVACGGPAGVRVMDPTAIVAASSPEATEQAILDTLPKRNWTPEAVEPGTIIATLAVRTHLLRVRIEYNAVSVTVRYVDSDNLDEDRDHEGHVYAHKKVNGWMAALATDLSHALAAVPATSGSP